MLELEKVSKTCRDSVFEILKNVNNGNKQMTKFIRWKTKMEEKTQKPSAIADPVSEAPPKTTTNSTTATTSNPTLAAISTLLVSDGKGSGLAGRLSSLSLTRVKGEGGGGGDGTGSREDLRAGGNGSVGHGEMTPGGGRGSGLGGVNGGGGEGGGGGGGESRRNSRRPETVLSSQIEEPEEFKQMDLASAFRCGTARKFTYEVRIAR